jgi:SAM-dependent methyltransferase
MNTVLYAARLLADFQFSTIHQHMNQFVPRVEGTLLDVGCGQSPFVHLVNSTKAKYIGVDTDFAQEFGYRNERVVRFDGVHLPFESDSVDAVMCTEVLEHVKAPEAFIAELNRVLKPGGRAVLTVPWSARYHFIPHDFYRFTPPTLERMCSSFSQVTVEARGNDLSVIGAKMIVALVRLLRPRPLATLPFRAVLALPAVPWVAVGFAIGKLSLMFNFGSKDDPLGYTVWLTK